MRHQSQSNRRPVAARMDTHNSAARMQPSAHTSAVRGRVRWSPTKSLWWFAMTLLALHQAATGITGPELLVFLTLSAITLCLGHSLGMHRRLIHQAYQCPLWMEYFFVYCGTLVGMAGPLGMTRTHDTRDWAQRQTHCHDYFAHRQSFWRDAWWQLHCELVLDHPPHFALDPHIAGSRFYPWLERTWMLQQLPLAALLWVLGGWSFVAWRVCARISVSLTGHWLVGHFAHRSGHQDYVVDGAGVQGHNVGLMGINGLLTMGECWHNHHHAFPGSAHLGLHAGQPDPGWWVLQVLRRVGLVWGIMEPHNLPTRPAVRTLAHATLETSIEHSAPL